MDFHSVPVAGLVERIGACDAHAPLATHAHTPADPWERCYARVRITPAGRDAVK